VNEMQARRSWAMRPALRGTLSSVGVACCCRPLRDVCYTLVVVAAASALLTYQLGGHLPTSLPHAAVDHHRSERAAIIRTEYSTTTTILRPFVWDNPGRPVPEETFTRSHPSWSTYFLYHLFPFAMVHGILFIQLTCMTSSISNNLFPGTLWSSPRS